MAIATRAEIKALLNITDTSKDTHIDSLLPVLSADIITFTNNYFHTSKYISASTIAFVEGTPATITDSGNGFITAGLENANDIHVESSLDNDGWYRVASVVAGTITLATGETLVSESAGEGVCITRMNFGKGLQFPLSQMVQMALDGTILKGFSAESLSEHAVSTNSMGEWPKSIIGMLKQYRQLKWEPNIRNSNYYQVGGI